MKQAILSLAGLAARLLPEGARKAVYRLPWLARLVRGGLNRAAPQGLAQVRVAAGELAGRDLLLDLQQEKDYWLGTYEIELQQAIRAQVKPGMVAYDVGANIGYITLLLAQAVGEQGQVFAFEALPSNVERLRGNLALNRMEGRVKVVPAAVVEATRPVRFLVGPSGGTGKAEGSAGRQELAYGSTLEVAGISLDEFVYGQGQPAPQVIKLDIEGGEVLALPGMRRVLREARPVLLVELHGNESAQAAWRELKEAGYRLARLEKGLPPIGSVEELDWKAYLVASPEEGEGGAS